MLTHASPHMHDHVSLVAWARQAAIIYSIYISTASRGWNIFFYLKIISTSVFITILHQHLSSQMQSVISLFIFVNTVLHILFLCTMCAYYWPPLIRRLKAAICKCCRNRPILGLIPGSATVIIKGGCYLFVLSCWLFATRPFQFFFTFNVVENS